MCVSKEHMKCHLKEEMKEKKQEYLFMDYF